MQNQFTNYKPKFTNVSGLFKPAPISSTGQAPNPLAYVQANLPKTYGGTPILDALRIPSMQAYAQTTPKKEVKSATTSYQIGSNPNVQYSNAADQAKLAAWEGANARQVVGTPPGTPPGNGDNGESGENDEQRRLQEALDAAYDPAIRYLNDLERTTREQNTADIAGINERYGTYAGRLPAEQAQGEAEIASQEQLLGESQRSAYDQAIRAYNALRQQGGAKFGAGSSTGGALGELATQEFFRNQGQIGQKGVEATQQINVQKQKLSDYIKQKGEDLRFQKEDAIAQLNKALQQGLQQIGASRTNTEQGKAQAKLQLIQSAMETQRAIEAQDRELKQQIALYAAQQFTQISGRQFTQPELEQFVLQQTGQPMVQATPVNEPNLVGGNILGGTPEDQLGGVLAPGLSFNQ